MVEYIIFNKSNTAFQNLLQLWIGLHNHGRSWRAWIGDIQLDGTKGGQEINHYQQKR